MAEVPTKFRSVEVDDVQEHFIEQVIGEAELMEEIFCKYLVPSRETSLARTKLEECVMWANKSIARNGLV